MKKKLPSRRTAQPRSGVTRPPDRAIDTTDIPPLTSDFFANAVRNPFYRPVKQATTVRLDADVLAWLRSQGPGYQTRLNAILRAAMLRDGGRTIERAGRTTKGDTR